MVDPADARHRCPVFSRSLPRTTIRKSTRTSRRPPQPALRLCLYVRLLSDLMQTLTDERDRTCAATIESVQSLSEPTLDAYEAIAQAVVRVHANHMAASTPTMAYQKQLDAHLRALKTLFVDLLAASRSNGTLRNGTQGDREARRGGKGKGKEQAGDVEMRERDRPIVDVSRHLAVLYSLAPAPATPSPFLGPSSFAPPAAVQNSRLSPTLDALLDLLDDASRSDHAGSRLSGTAQRIRVADHICTLLARSIRGFAEQQAIAAGGKGREALSALRRLVESGSEKVRFTFPHQETFPFLVADSSARRSRRRPSTR